MKKLLKNTKGAVTVFVTMLLIPAILVSGTAVDLARIYTARSTLQDANQLAANSVLSQYDALLYDLYGLFGVAKDDPVLARLLDDYISVAVFGDDGAQKASNTLQLFYGSNLTLEDVGFAENKNLRDADTLRRQIEEYMKLRGPVLIVKELLEMLGSSTFSEDAGVIDDKIKVDKTAAEIFEKYGELYEAIQIADLCAVPPSDTAGALGNVTGSIENLWGEIVALGKCYEQWKDEDDPETKADLAAKYNALLVNIEVRTKGGRAGKNWKNGAWKSKTSNLVGLDTTIVNALGRADSFKAKFDKVVELAAELDVLSKRLAKETRELEERLKNGECNAELREAITQPDPISGKSMMETYREIAERENIEEMAEIYKDGGYSYIDEALKPMMDGVEYRNMNDEDAPSLERKELAKASTHPSLVLTSPGNIAKTLAEYDFEDVTYKMPPGFVKFGEHPGENAEFFEQLKMMAQTPPTKLTKLFDGQSEARGADSKKQQTNMIDELTRLAADAYAGMTNEPLGAKYVSVPSAGEIAHGAAPVDISKAVSDAQSDPVRHVISDPRGSIERAGDYLLLLTYCTSVFSDYSTARPDINGKKMDEVKTLSFPLSITGVPISPEVNYFFNSELEYLYNGSSDAGENLNAVSRLIFLVRVICNYITVFSVAEVTGVVSAIRAAFMWCAPLGVALGELARAAFVAAESTVDLAALRSGGKVPLIKNSAQWVCSPSGLVKALATAVTAAVSESGGEGESGNKDGGDDKGDGISYSGYLLFFMLAKGLGGDSARARVADRAADLIEWNIINYKSGIWCDEEKMTEELGSEHRYRMEDMKTAVEITTSVDMRMLFLSMAAAQDLSDAGGIGLTRTRSFTATDYRGY